MSIVNNSNPFSSIIDSSQWFTDMVATSTHIASTAPNVPIYLDGLANTVDDYATPLSPTNTGDSIFDPLGFPQLLSGQETSLTGVDTPFIVPLSMAPRNPSDNFCKGTWIEELAKLNSRVSRHDHLANTTSNHVTSERSRSCSQSTQSEKPAINGPICLDEALSLTKDLIELLDRLSCAENSSAQNDIPEVGNEAFHDLFQNVALGTSIRHLDISVSNEKTRIPNPISEDPFTILLFMSCYVRLIDLYKLLFAHIQAVVTKDGPQAASPLLLRSQLPTIVVGPFSLCSNPKLEVMIIIELVKFVMGRIGHAVRLLAPGSHDDQCQDSGHRIMTPGTTQSMDHIVTSMLSAVQESEKDLMGAIHSIRDVMTQRHLI